jgi:hypothetical protein
MATEAPGQMVRGSVPVPDPTALTTENLRREILGLRELLESKSAGDLALVLEKFLKVEQQFELVERQRVEQKKDTKDAVDAALTAQKEAVKEQTTASERAIAKSETGTNKQLEQLAENFRTENSGLRVTIDDLKDRVRGIEANKQGASEVRVERTSNVMQVTAVIGMVIFFLGFVVALVALIFKP